MKIAVVGAEASGKTTIATALSGALGLDLVEDARPALLRQSGYHTLFEWAHATAGVEQLLRDQAARERDRASAIVDYGVIDQFIFLQRWIWNGLSPERVESLRDLVVEAARSYTHVMVTAPRIVAGHAPHRFRNARHALQQHRLLTALLRELALPAVHELPAEAADLVVAQALAHVRGRRP